MTRKPLDPSTPGASIVAEEQEILARVELAVAQRAAHGDDGPQPGGAYDQELLSLRDQVAEAKPEDVAPLVEQMARVAALAAGRRREVSLPIDPASPYFAHMRLREGGEAGDPNGPSGSGGPATEVKRRDILIGRRGYIDRASGVQIVDWRDAPVSQIYYRYDEGDDYDEVVDARHLAGVVEARRNVTIHAGALRRIGCPQGTFVSSGEGRWFEAEGVAAPTLQGGSGKAARPPRPTVTRPQPRQKGQRRTLGVHSGPVPRADKQLPEIAALIDPAQFDLITGGGGGSTGLVVIQGGAGSGKTTVALHRVAWLVFHDPQHFRPGRCLVVVPSQALERYVAGVLPALGVRGVPVVTFRGWARATRRKVLPRLADRYTEETPSAVIRIKKHPAMLSLLEQAVAERTQAAGQELIAAPHSAEARAQVTWHWEEHKAEPLLERLASMARFLRAPAGQALEGADRQRIELTLTRVRRRSRDLGGLFAEVLTDTGRLRAALPEGGEEGVTNGEIAQLVEWVAAQQEERPEVELADVDAELRTPVDTLLYGTTGELDDSGRDAAAGRLDAEDDALLLRLAQLAAGGLMVEKDGGREPLRYDHIAIDEAQDLSAVEIKVLLDAAAPQRGGQRSVTLCGDVAQRLIFDNAFHGWDQLLADVGLSGTPVRPLHLSYRSTEEVMLFARAVLGELAHEEEIAARPGAPVELFRFDAMGEAVGFLAEALRSLAGREPTASIALLSRYPAQADAWHQALVRAEVPSLRRVRRQDFAFAPGVDVTDITQVKGLEFDYVVLLDVTPANYPNAVEARHLMHIGATRAAHQLWLISVGTPSQILPADLVATASDQP